MCKIARHWPYLCCQAVMALPQPRGKSVISGRAPGTGAGAELPVLTESLDIYVMLKMHKVLL